MEKVKCINCIHIASDYITSYQAIGLYRIYYCGLRLSGQDVIDPYVERECKDYKIKEVKNELELPRPP